MADRHSSDGDRSHFLSTLGVAWLEIEYCMIYPTNANKSGYTNTIYSYDDPEMNSAG